MALTTNVSLVGNLTRDPELRFTPSGTPVATFGVAVNVRRRTDKGWEDGPTHFYNVTAWRDLGKHVAESLEKGARVVVVGRLNHRTWDSDDGAKRSAVDIVADACGPDLTWATAQVSKVTRQGPPHPAYDPAEEPF